MPSIISASTVLSTLSVSFIAVKTQLSACELGDECPSTAHDDGAFLNEGHRLGDVKEEDEERDLDEEGRHMGGDEYDPQRQRA